MQKELDGFFSTWHIYKWLAVRRSNIESPLYFFRTQGSRVKCSDIFPECSRGSVVRERRQIEIVGRSGDTDRDVLTQRRGSRSRHCCDSCGRQVEGNQRSVDVHDVELEGFVRCSEDNNGDLQRLKDWIVGGMKIKLVGFQRLYTW